ncbi:hypothetical protein BJ138DRAFT_1111787 [Hygrophoropsis aurantiaca]|uniref:Uncharacterized protein n=1 Tax=Hygrophoropsis aurantiaca TaxID=72124 RepID=A0ACB8AHQ7_9AGAM|nr:hypothetical protein BJ138DRAFT_1111787 [Hygrophoropsis aurantiaca]
MSLDQNLFTLLITPNNSDSTVLDLVDPSGIVHYRKRRILGQVYKIEVYEPVSESLLVSATAPSATSKHKTLELYNPAHVVELKYTGTLTFRWSFQWEEHEFEWKREECFMVRKPDPPVLVAVTKEPPGRIKTTSVQILDYNLNRFDIEDRKGLEIVILTALLTFQDQSDVYHETPATAALPTAAVTPPMLKTLTDFTTRKSSGGATSGAPPIRPPKPAPKTGIDRIAELQAGTGEVNEVSVSEEGKVKDYAQYCAKLLQDDAMLFITVRSSDAAQIPKVMQVVEETRRIRHKAGPSYSFGGTLFALNSFLGFSDDKDLHQYVVHDTSKPSAPSSSRRINLNDVQGQRDESKNVPPNSLVIHLSKIDMPEFRPRRIPPSSHGIMQDDIGAGDGHKEGRKERKEREKREKEKRAKREAEKNGKDKATSSNSNSPPTNKITKAPTMRPPASSLPNRSRNHVYPHQIHPLQPSPSPSQLNNPMIYAAPPLPLRAPNHAMTSPPHYPPYTSNFAPNEAQNHYPQHSPPTTVASAPVSGLFDKFFK